MRVMDTTFPDTHVALRKVTRPQTDQWAGHLTPAEAWSLVETGGQASPHDLA